MQGFTYSVDLALVIDATGSMSPIIDQVKKSALCFYDDLREEMAKKEKSIDLLRVRVVVFRDFYADGADALRTSGFFTLPDDAEEFAAFVSGITATGGGDEPESGLEALAAAMRSEWSTSGSKRRQVIVLWTDASAHKLEKNSGSKPSHYPDGMPKNLDELTDMWEGQSFVDANAKRLILYAPDAYAWSDIGTAWENIIHFPSKGGSGLKDVEYNAILDAIARSV